MRLQYPQLQTILDIPPDQLAVWPRSYWNGRTGVLDISHPDKLSILITPHFDPCWTSLTQTNYRYLLPLTLTPHKVTTPTTVSTHDVTRHHPHHPSSVETHRITLYYSKNTHNFTTAMSAPSSNPIRQSLLQGLMGHLAHARLGQGTTHAAPKTIQDTAP